MPAELERDWDAIVIGSGMGGLAFASLYAQLGGKRVLVLERHTVAGGFTHSFARKAWRWDVGLHYVGGMRTGAAPRRLMDLITGGTVEWRGLPEGYDVYHYPDLSVTAWSDEGRYEAELRAAFPAEGEAIGRYFRDVRKTAEAMGPQIWSWSQPAWVGAPLRWWGWKAAMLAEESLAEYLGRNFQDRRLRGVLASNWGDYGLTPERASFATHALITASYFGGAYFPLGGAGQIAKGALAIVEREGGACRTGQRVDRVVLEGGKAVGVRVGEREYRAPLVVSNAGAAATKALVEGAEREDPEDGATAVTMYLGLSESPAKLGLRGENHWVHESYEHRIREEMGSVFLSFSSLNSGEAGAHTAQVMAIADSGWFQKWRGTRWRKRGAEYEVEKEQWGERLLDLAERAVPGLRALVAYREISTPLTVSHFTGGPGIYGTPGTVERFRARRPSVRTEVEGLLLTGADACTLGIQGAMMGGAFAAGYALDRLGGFRQVQRAAERMG
jgi:phytoene dehydrogenase-like protein